MEAACSILDAHSGISDVSDISDTFMDCFSLGAGGLVHMRTMSATWVRF